MSAIQIVRFGDDGTAKMVLGDSDCDRDPCAKHGTCHCRCVCFIYEPGDERYDDCDDCREAFGDGS